MQINKFVNKLCISGPLQGGNAPWVPFPGLSLTAFLPTMKFQPSQLPKIVGSGRVTT
ncbi:hypothetical protein M4R22_07405 [Acidovorax sp. GBBC 3334]|uniref:hypothetical protein n=1 Tax=unclassified Acidovorax TaxID=2684926 RepID=UPI002303B0B8|nr:MULTISPECIES: hypothetical protein [unclassified Acidovorax]MDA8454584.1 hypothetical protein [Acidovorax sp. GBBC 3334]MDA8519699.1 hypothetical protein [Acidovorax sp. NCPPB 4044]